MQVFSRHNSHLPPPSIFLLSLFFAEPTDLYTITFSIAAAIHSGPTAFAIKNKWGGTSSAAPFLLRYSISLI